MDNDKMLEIKLWLSNHVPIEHDGSFVPISEVRRLLIIRGAEARSDTAKRIFEELDKIMNRHLNSSPIEDIDTADELRLEEDYLTLKRKYKVD